MAGLLCVQGGCIAPEDRVEDVALSPVSLGPTGATGPTGEPGADGLDGEDGRNGKEGKDGQDGATGPRGATGATGAKGATGSTVLPDDIVADSFSWTFSKQGAAMISALSFQWDVSQQGILFRDGHTVVNLTDGEGEMRAAVSLPVGARPFKLLCYLSDGSTGSSAAWGARLLRHNLVGGAVLTDDEASVTNAATYTTSGSAGTIAEIEYSVVGDAKSDANHLFVVHVEWSNSSFSDDIKFHGCKIRYWMDEPAY